MTLSSSTQLNPVHLVAGLRTPMGRFSGALATVRSDDMAAHVIQALVATNPALAERVDQVVFGATNQAGEDNRNVARMALLLAGLPYEVPAVTVNRLCGSGLEAIGVASRMIAVGEAECVIAGGVESMSRAPYVQAKPEKAYSRGAPKIYDSSLGWRFPNPKMAQRFDPISMGETAENVAVKHGIGREEQDAYALASHQKAAAAQSAGHFDAEIVPVSVPQRRGEPIEVSQDESVRPNTSLEKLARLPTVFRKDGTVTAGNASPLSDGAAAVMLCSERLLKELGATSMGRIVANATVGLDPNYMGEGPIGAVRKLLQRSGLRVPNIDLFELNEAFAAQSLACARTLGLDEEKVNVHGGAIALGHPIGCSGARIMVTLAHAMKARQAQLGVATLCIGVGQGIATLLERGE